MKTSSLIVAKYLGSHIFRYTSEIVEIEIKFRCKFAIGLKH